MSTTTSAGADSGTRLAMVRERWDQFAVRFTATTNKRVTLQCARELHAHMQLGAAQSVLEVAAGAGLGSLDIIERMTSSSDDQALQQQQQQPPLASVGAGANAIASASTLESTHRRRLMVTDLSPRMVELAAETLQHASTERLDVRVAEANGQDLKDIATGSVDRFIANMCLQLTPDPDAMLRESKRVLTADGVVGFTIWGRPEHSGNFTIDSAVNKELGLTDGAESPNFALGKDLPALRQRFAAAGYSQVRIWPHLCVVSLWSGDEYAVLQQETNSLVEKHLLQRRYELWKSMGDEWLATKGIPIGLEAYIVIAAA